MEMDDMSLPDDLENGNINDWNRTFQKIITFVIAIISISSCICIYLTEEMREEAIYEYYDFSEGVIKETNHETDFVLDLEPITYALRQSAFYGELIVWYYNEAEATSDPELKEKNTDEAWRSMFFANSWNEIFYEELGKLTGKEYQDTSEGLMDESAMPDLNKLTEESIAEREAIREETKQHMDEGKDNAKRSARMELSIILFSISLLLAGISLIPDAKRTKYTLLIFDMVIYITGLVLMGITAFA